MTRNVRIAYVRGQDYIPQFCRVCRKWGHPTRRAAKAERTRLRKNLSKKKGDEGPAPLSIYPCPHGNGLHIGHLPQDVRNGTLDKDEYVEAVAEKQARRRSRSNEADLPASTTLPNASP